MRIAILFALLGVLSAEHAAADQVPTELVPFLRYIIQIRAEHGLKATAMHN